MKHIFQKTMGYIIAFLVVVMYFVLSYLVITDWRLNSAKTIVEGLLLFASAVMVYSSLTKQGIINGKSDTKYIETVTSHITTKQKIFPKIKYLQSWFNKDYNQLMKIGRTVFTDSAGYDYNKVFTEDGKVITDFKVEKPKPITYPPKTKMKWLKRLFRWMFSSEWKVYREKKNYIRKAKQYKVTRLTVSSVINIDAGDDPNNFGISEKEYLKRQNGMNIVSRMIFSFLMPSVSFAFNGFSIELLLVQTISVMMIIISALVSMFAAYFFMIRTHRGTIIKMVNKLEEFDNADLKEFQDKEKEDERIHTKESICSQSSVVEEIRAESHIGENSGLCGNT